MKDRLLVEELIDFLIVWVEIGVPGLRDPDQTIKRKTPPGTASKEIENQRTAIKVLSSSRTVRM